MGNETEVTSGSENNAQTPATEGQQNGVETRINELTSQMKAQQDQYNQLMQNYQQLLVTTMERQGAPTTKTDPYADMIPQDVPDETKKMMSTMLEKFAGIVDARFGTIQNQLAATNVAAEAQKLASQYGVTEQVAARAQELAAGWRAKGLNFPVEDALRFAAGEVALAHKPDPRSSQVMPVFRAANPVPQVAPQQQQGPLPEAADLVEEHGVEGAWRLLAKRIGI